VWDLVLVVHVEKLLRATFSALQKIVQGKRRKSPCAQLRVLRKNRKLPCGPVESLNILNPSRARVSAQ
jgi:hypothetical protein